MSNRKMRRQKRKEKKQQVIIHIPSPELDAMHGNTSIEGMDDILYMLKKADPDGKMIRAEKVAVISFEETIDIIAMTLGIPKRNTGRYWKLHECNVEHCEILLLVGTPEIDLHRLPNKYRDQKIADLLIDGELKTAYYKIMPHLYPNRTIISFCDRDIKGVPVTETITEIPR